MDFIGNGFKNSTNFRYRPPSLGVTELELLFDFLKVGTEAYKADRKAKEAEEARKAAEAAAVATAAAAAAAAQAGAQRAAGEIIPGVPNTVTLIGGLALAGGIGYLAFKK